jgi:hypothetical protein
VEATDTTTGATYQDTTTSDGLLRLPLPEGVYRLRFNGVLAPEFRTLLAVPDGGITALQEWTVSRGAAISGRAALEDQVIVPDLENDVVPSVTAINAQGESFISELDAGGRYEFRGLPAGLYDLIFETPQTVPVRIAGIQAIADETVNVADLISVYGGTVSGRTLDSQTGQPIANVPVTVEFPNGLSRGTTSDSDGNFTVEGVLPGTVAVVARTSETLAAEARSVNVERSETTSGVDLQLVTGQLGTATGIITLNAAPIENAAIDLLRSGTVVVSAVTAADGSFSTTALLPGTYDVQVSAPGAVTQTGTLTIQADQVTTQDFQLQFAANLRGRITQTGMAPINPVNGLSLLLLPPDNVPRLLITDRDGQFGAEELAPGNYSLMLPDGSHRHDFTVDIATGTVQIDFEIQAGAIVGRVTAPDGKTELTDITVTLISGDDVVASTRSLSDGRYLFPFISPGQYSLRFSSENYTISPVTGVQLSPGTHAEVDVSAADASVTLTLQEQQTSAPTTVPFAVVLMPLDDAAGTVLRTQLSESGLASFEHLAPGQYRVVADDGTRGYQWDITINNGTNDVALTLADLTTVSGVVTDPDGATVTEGRVVVFDNSGNLRWETTLGSNGEYSLMLPEGTWNVVVTESEIEDTLPGMLAATTVTVTGSDATLDLQLSTGNLILTGTLTSSGSFQSVPAGAEVVLLNNLGVPLRRTAADFDGQFSFDKLTAGSYAIDVVADGFRFDSVPVTLIGSQSVNVPGSWHATGIGRTLQRENSGDSFTSDGEGGALSSWIRQGIDGIRRKLKEQLRTPQEQPRLIRAPRIPSDLCGAAAAQAKAAIQRALAMQRAADGFFESWQQAYLAAQEQLWANVGLFGINLLQFATDLYVQTPKVKAFVNRDALAQFDNIADSLSGARKFVNAETKSWSHLLAQANVEDTVIPALRKTFFELSDTLAFRADVYDAAISSVGAGTAVASSGVTELNGPTSLSGVFSAIERLGREQSLGSISGVVSAVTGFGGRLATHASALVALLPQIDKAINSLPQPAKRAMQKLKDTIGPIAGALNTISAATQGISDIMGDIKRLDDVEANYKNALKRRDEALREAQNIIANAGKKGSGDCPDPPPPPPGPPGGSGGMGIAGSFDPNDIIGPAGFGDDRFVQSNLTFPYTIRFENLDTATAAAQEVFIDQQLSSDLDWTTFEFGSFGWSGETFDVPRGRSQFDIRIDKVDTLGLYIDVSASLDQTTGHVSWVFTSIDPATGDLTADVLAGFLPPNQTSPEGEGFVEYYIRPKATIADNTTIAAEARIVFDLNAPIDTPVYTNTIDDSAPSSSVNALPTWSPANFEVSWSSDDGAGSGAQTFDVFFSRNGGPFELWLDDTPETSGTFQGMSAGTYAFYSVATDGVGLQEPVPATADAATTIEEQVFYSPAENTADVQPTFLWDAVPGATSYEIWVKNLSTDENPFHRGTSTTNSYTPSEPLGIGRYRVWRRSLDSAGNPSGWPEPYTFRITTPVAVAPMERFYTDSTPTISWDALPGAATYEMWIDNITTGERRFVYEAALTDTEWTAPSDWDLGTYRIWVRGTDAGGIPTWWYNFTEIIVRTPPVAQTPLNATFDASPTFEWSPVTGAATYEIFVRNRSTGTTEIYETGLATPQFTPATDLADGPYRWWAIAVSAEGVRSLWSDPTDVFIGGRTTVTAPTATTSNTTPEFRWLAVEQATRYDLWVDEVGGNTQVIREQNLTGTTFTPTSPLAAGTYRVWIRAVSGSQLAPWSEMFTFSIV